MQAGGTIRWSEDVRPPSMWSKPDPFEEQKTVNARITEAIHRKQEELFAAWLAERGLKDYRQMPFSEQRTEMKHRTFALLYGARETEETK